MVSRKTSTKVISKYIKEQEEQFCDLRTYFYSKRYQELQQKFSPWVCLRELDLVATVSFRGYDIIHKVEFHDAVNPRYQRGLLKSRQELSRLSKMLETYGSEILPFELTSNLISDKPFHGYVRSSICGSMSKEESLLLLLLQWTGENWHGS